MPPEPQEPDLQAAQANEPLSQAEPDLQVEEIQLQQPSPEETQPPRVQEAEVREASPEETQPARVQEAEVRQPSPEETQPPQVQEAEASQPPLLGPQTQDDPVEAPAGQAPVLDRGEKPTVAEHPPVPEKREATEPPAGDAGIEAAWSEIDRTTGKACEELKAVQGVRVEAMCIRSRAQWLLDEAEAVQEEAELVMAHGRDSLAKAVALNPKALKSMANIATALAEAMRTEWRLRQRTRQQAEEEADWARQRATDAILDALAAVRKLSNCVSRELEEANRTAATAESFRESSQNDMKHAQAMMAEAESVMRREARRLLNQTENGGSVPPSETAAPPRTQPGERRHQPPTRRSEPEPQTGSSPPVEAEMAASSSGDEVTSPGVDSSPSQEAAELEPDMPSSWERPSFSQVRPEVPSSARLEALLDEFRRSLETPKPASTADEAVDAVPAHEAPDAAEAATPGVQEQPSHSLGHQDVPSTDELEAALTEFQRSLEEPERSPGGEDVRDAPSPQVVPDLQPDMPGLPVQPLVDQGQPDTASTADLAAALEEFLATSEESQPATAGGEMADSGRPQEAVEPEPHTPSAQGQSGLPSTDDLQSALDDFLRSVKDPEAALPGGEIGDSAHRHEIDQPKPDVPGIQEQSPAAQDQPDTSGSDELQSALNEFLRSTEKPPSAPARQEPPETPILPTEGIFLDNMDFSGTERVEPHQQPSNEEVKPVESPESTIRPPVSAEPPFSAPQEEVGDDLFAQLRESLAGISSGEVSAGTSPTDVKQESQVFEPPPGPERVDGLQERSQGVEPASAPDSSQPIPVAETYSGILYIIVTPADEASLSFFWNVLDAVAGLGKVIDAQAPLPDGSGHQFTLDLGREPLVLQQLMRQIPTSKIVAMASDRIHVELVGIAD